MSNNSNWTLMNYQEFKRQINKTIAGLGTVLELKGAVETTQNLPLSNNKKGDVWIVSEDRTEWVWISDNPSGTIENYERLGSIDLVDRFLVTLTIEYQSESGGDVVLGGTTDKTMAEITSAYEAGKRIVARVIFTGNVNEFQLSTVSYEPEVPYPTFQFQAKMTSWTYDSELGAVLNCADDAVMVFPYSTDGTSNLWIARIQY